MTPARDNYFLSTISHLREQEEMLIYDRCTSTTTKEEKAVADLLGKEYAKEVMNFPGIAPSFEREAAVWAARVVFNASQLLLSREQDAPDIVKLLPPYSGAMTPAAILSADLCLRCLPDIIEKAREINPDDPLIGLLEHLLRDWHYSGIGYSWLPEGSGEAKDTGDLFDFSPILADDCLRLLYIDRVIERRVTALANLPELRAGILAVMGDHNTSFWKEL
jgi:hypothetical protein